MKVSGGWGLLPECWNIVASGSMCWIFQGVEDLMEV